MSKIRFITSSDEHISDIAPGFRKDDYRASILKKLEWQGQFAKKCGSNAVLRGGDLFHVKAANRTSHATMQMVARLHKNYSCPTFSLAGNHDMTNNDPDSVMRQQPLGVLFSTHTVNPLKNEIFESGSLKVRVVGIDYTTDLGLDYIHDSVRKTDEDQHVVAFIHALAGMAPSEKTQSFFNENIIDYRDLVFQGCPDVYIFGHYHKDQGIVDHLGVQFVNLGAISRGALTFENLERKPKVSMLTFDSAGLSVEEVIVPHEDSSQIFDLDLKKRIDTERKDLNDFIQKLKSDISISYDVKREELKDYPEDLRALANELIEAAEAGVLDDGE
jgi:DNA repair exonuclease SbcCD nuclease subunit